MFFLSAFISASTVLDLCAASRNASRSAEPIAGISRSITYLGMTAPPQCVGRSFTTACFSRKAFDQVRAHAHRWWVSYHIALRATTTTGQQRSQKCYNGHGAMERMRLQEGRRAMWVSTGILLGFVAWFILRYIVTSFYVVNQSERAVKTSFGRAQRLRASSPHGSHATVLE